MAAHSRILAWRIPWTEEPGRLQSIGLQRVRHDGSDFTHTHTHTHTHTQVTVTCLTSVSRTEVRSRGQRQGGGQRAAPAAVRNQCPRTAKQGLRTLVTNGRWTRRRKGVKDAFKERGRRS